MVVVITLRLARAAHDFNFRKQNGCIKKWLKTSVRSVEYVYSPTQPRHAFIHLDSSPSATSFGVLACTIKSIGLWESTRQNIPVCFLQALRSSPEVVA